MGEEKLYRTMLGKCLPHCYPLLPMCLVLLTTQMIFPNVGTRHHMSISMTPRGVAGMSIGSPEQYLPEEEEEG